MALLSEKEKLKEKNTGQSFILSLGKK